MIDVIVGLGNPGKQYAQTRHNCGFMVVEALAARWQVSLATDRRFQGRWGEASLSLLQGRQKIRLICPETYMNRSGQAVRALIDWFKLDPQRVLVVYDDMAIPFGRLRLRPNGSAGGHNGMKSMIEHLGGSEWPRLRVGVGNPDVIASHADVVGHVLGGFAPSEQKQLPEVIATAADCVEALLKVGLELAMSRYNAREIATTTT